MGKTFHCVRGRYVQFYYSLGGGIEVRLLLGGGHGPLGNSLGHGVGFFFFYFRGRRTEKGKYVGTKQRYGGLGGTGKVRSAFFFWVVAVQTIKALLGAEKVGLIGFYRRANDGLGLGGRFALVAAVRILRYAKGCAVDGKVVFVNVR